jgi:hypothetical protein
MSTRAVSVNDEAVASPRLRKDQKVKIRTLVRNNAEHPLIAQGLVRDMLKGYPCTVQISEDETLLEVTTRDIENKMYCTYGFRFHPYLTIETPTLP